jgi:hypothetical protein
MLWPSQGVLVFAFMSAIPPLIALLRGNARAFGLSTSISILAGLLARSTYLVPVAIVLLILSFVIASQQLTTSNDLPRAARWIRRAAPWIVPGLLLASFVAIGTYALWLWLAFNWGPPRMLERAFVEGSTRQRDQAMTEILNSQFPHGTNEALLKLALVGQGFADARDPYPQCRSTQSAYSVAYIPCPSRTREMKYDIQSIVCGTSHLFVNWSVDDDGKLTRLEASERSVCW